MNELLEASGQDKVPAPPDQWMWTVLRHSPEGIAVLDAGLRYLFVNERFCHELGLKENDLAGKQHSETGQWLPETWHAAYEQCLAGAEEKSGGGSFRRPDGSTAHVQWKCHPWFDAKGGIGGVAMHVHENTGYKQLEEAMRRQKEDFEMIFNTVPAQIWIKDIRNGFVRVNDKICRDLGMTREAIEGHTAEELFPEFAAKYYEDDLEVIHSGRPKLGIVEQITTPSGSRLWLHTDKFPVWDEQGNVSGLLIFVVDLTMRMQAEEALRASEERLHLAACAGHIGVWDWDIVNNKLTWDDNMYPLFGVAKEQFGQTYEAWARTVHPEDRLNAEGEVQAALRNEREYEPEFRIIRPSDGAVRFIKGQSTTFRDPQGRPLRMVGINVDITERKQAEESLRKAREAAEIASQAKDQFIAVLSHELRTPLVPVLATVAALESEPGLPPSLKADLDLIRNNVEMEARLIDDLLDITKISKGKTELHPEIADAQACLQTALGICTGAIEAKQIKVGLDLQAARHHVWADPTRLQQIFWNLLSNAAKFTPQGGQITVRSENSGEELQITVSDTGIGIDPAVMPRLFKLFEQGQQSKNRQFGGLGLGLSIAKALAELHHGTLTASSEGRGRGATFMVTLATVPAPAETPFPAMPAAPTAEPSRRILLVDDHPDTLQTLGKLLRRWGYDVTMAKCVREALELASREPFDLLVSDLGLPDGSGLEIMRGVGHLYGLRGIALSGYGTEEDVRESREAGFEEHMTKPVDFERLREAIRRVTSAEYAAG